MRLHEQPKAVNHKMTTQNILASIGKFSFFDLELFENHTTQNCFDKNDVILKEDEVCKSLYFIQSGSFFQFQIKDIDEVIIDLHLEGEWMFNHQSLTEQTPSKTTIKAFSKSEVIELSLENFHALASKSTSFLQFHKILNQTHNRTYIFDNSLSPAERYDYIKRAKPRLVKVFPIKMIASFLKIAPETLSRVRAKY
jgi:CRP-like cAMP-binding protein